MSKSFEFLCQRIKKPFQVEDKQHLKLVCGDKFGSYFLQNNHMHLFAQYGTALEVDEFKLQLKKKAQLIKNKSNHGPNKDKGLKRK